MCGWSPQHAEFAEFQGLPTEIDSPPSASNCFALLGVDLVGSFHAKLFLLVSWFHGEARKSFESILNDL